MRKTLILASSLLICASAACAALGDEFDGVAPALKTADRVEWAWDGGDRAEIAVPATVHYQAGGTPRVIVAGRRIFWTGCVFQDGELKLKENLFGDNDTHGEKLDVTLTGMKLQKVELAGRVDMDMGEIHQDQLQLSIAGRGSLNASGNADDLTVHIAGSGDYQLGKLAARSIRVDIAGSGQVEAASPATARINIVGSGQVRFAAMPKDISTNIIGSGRISDADGHVIDRHG